MQPSMVLLGLGPALCRAAENGAKYHRVTRVCEIANRVSGQRLDGVEHSDPADRRLTKSLLPVKRIFGSDGRGEFSLDPGPI